MALLNETHDPALRSWVESANADSDFPIQNLPFGVFRRKGSSESFRGGVAIGDQVLDLAAAHAAGVLAGATAEVAALAVRPKLNALMARGPAAWSSLRLALSRALRVGSPAQAALEPCLVPQAMVEHDVPAEIGDFTDFYASVHHATNVGRMFRPDNPLLPNYKWVPIAYHGRASSIGVSGQHVRRPSGQTRAPDAAAPVFGPCRRLDYELELGVFVGVANDPGEPIPMDRAEDHLFGLCLLNDWSARDLQAWEYQPLGPFLAKNFATTISPWIVTLEALAPFRTPWTRPAGDPKPLPYLDSAANRSNGNIDLQLEVWIQSAAMRAKSLAPHRLSQTGFARAAYWSIFQMAVHHTSNGCNFRSGDLYGTGTMSGPRAGEQGSLLELTHGGKKPLVLPSGETRSFVEDGDTIIFRAFAQNAGCPRIGFGDCAATVRPGYSSEGGESLHRAPSPPAANRRSS